MTETTRLSSSSGKADPRVDKLATWLLQAAMTVALAVGGWYARETGEKVEELATAQGDTRTELAVVRVELVALRASAQATDELRRELASVRLLVASLQSEVSTLRRDVDKPR